MKLKLWERALLCAVLLTFICGFSLDREQKDLSGKLIRLHVVANSDSDADQAVKLRVRDAVLEHLRPRLGGAEDAEEAREIITENLESIQAIAREVTGSDQVTAKIALESFPTTRYGTFSLPAGTYVSLRVVLGSGRGHNWWCVVFPPICNAPELDGTAAAALGLTEEELRLITEDSPKYVVKFRILELWERFIALF